jgi:hypothetical protein
MLRKLRLAAGVIRTTLMLLVLLASPVFANEIEVHGYTASGGVRFDVLATADANI